MIVLVTGARGMVGRAVVNLLERQGETAAAFGHQQLDIADKDKVDETVRGVRPDAIINCAAWTDVDGCETNVERAYAANSFGVENLARAARAARAAFVTISTDYVFDGTKEGFYTQRDDPAPTSIYGQAKLDGERRACVAYARSIIARTGWVYGAHGTNFLSRIATDTENLLRELQERGATIKAIDDAYGTPTHAADLAARLIELAHLDLPGIYHTAGGGSGTTYAEFTRLTLEHKGFHEVAAQLETVSHHDLKRPAPRPQNSRLRCLLSEKIGLPPLPDWKQKLAESGG